MAYFGFGSQVLQDVGPIEILPEGSLFEILFFRYCLVLRYAGIETERNFDVKVTVYFVSQTG